MSVLALVLLPLLAAPQETGTLLILHKVDDSLGFYNPQSGALLAKVPVGLKPHEFALSPDMKLAFVTNYGVDSYTDQNRGGHTISIVDLIERRTIGEIDLGRFHRPHGIERGESGLYYVTTDFPAALLVLDARERKVARSIELGQSLPHMVAVTHDEKTAYTTNSGSGSVSAVSLASGKVATHIAVGGVPMGLTLSSDGRRLFVVTRDGNQLVLIDTTTNAVERRITIPGNPTRVRLASGGGFLLVSLIGSGELAVVDAVKLTLVRRFAVGARPEGIFTDPQDRFGYVSAQGDDKVLKFSLRDWKPVLEIRTSAKPDPIAMIP